MSLQPITETNMWMTRGDTLYIGIKVTPWEAVEELPSVDAAYFTVRDSWTGAQQFQKSLSDGITVGTETDFETVLCRVAPEDTASLTPGQYVYDYQLTLSGDVFTPFKGALTIGPDATYGGE